MGKGRRQKETRRERMKERERRKEGVSKTGEIKV